MHGIADSLNVSVAAAVLLYEAVRQRAGSSQRPHGTGGP
jgi:tRNA G18 (ribose-2'-O)-methylase SpoU